MDPWNTNVCQCVSLCRPWDCGVCRPIMWRRKMDVCNHEIKVWCVCNHEGTDCNESQTWLKCTEPANLYYCNCTHQQAVQNASRLVFLPRDAMRKRCLCCRPVSVCPSVTSVDCIETAEIIVKLLSRPCGAVILLFLNPERRYPIPREPPSAGAQNTRGWEKYCVLRLKSLFISETVRYTPMVAMERLGNPRWRIDTCRFWWPWMILTGVSR